MAGATSVKCFADNPSSCPCLFLDSLSSVRPKIKASTASFHFESAGNRRQLKRIRMIDLSSSFLAGWKEWQLSAKILCPRKRKGTQKGLIVVDELGGQYDDTFNDVKMELINYFTFKAVRTVLEQLYEMNPPQYKWFNNFVADNVQNQGTRFLQILVKERRELAERVMVTRLSLYGRWIKKVDHGEIYNEISEENLKLMRERLMETIIWPSDDNTKPDQKSD